MLEDAGGGIGKMGDSWERESSQTLAPFMTTFSCAKTVDGGEQNLLEEPGAADWAGPPPSGRAEWQGNRLWR